MIDFTVNSSIFKFKYLPEFADFILKNHLVEFTTIGIRFSREVDLPMLKPLNKLTEEQLVELSLDANKLLLEKLHQNDIASYIEQNAKNWIENKLGIIDKEEIKAEDLTLAFFLRRKTFGYFLYRYTKNVELQKSIISELDVYTTQEELISYNIYLKIQQQKLAYQNELLMEVQELAEIGWFLIDYKDRSKSQFSTQYMKILELTDANSDPEGFADSVQPKDKERVLSLIADAMKNGGKLELEFSYNKSGKTKHIWMRAIVQVENGNPVLIKGTVRDITKRQELLLELEKIKHEKNTA
jgi:PAS domain-containing protein